ncbi:peroxin 14 [Diplocarpon rosae]|nr:peroxin 14 [Diplocarpon rosae]
MALARAGGEAAPANYSNYALPQQQVMRQPQPGYGQYQQPWPQPPPELPRRDWRDWFIMATVMGGVGYGLYFVAKRYVYPIIAPPTAPQLEQDKKAIDESFEKAFALLDQLAKDTEALKTSEQARTDRLDAAMADVEDVVRSLKVSSAAREEDSRRMGDEVRGLRNMIPQALDAQKENTDSRLRELNTELRSLKTLMSQRLNPTSSTATNVYGRAPGLAPPIAPSVGPSTATNGSTTSGSPVTDMTIPKPALVGNTSGTESVASIQNRSASAFNTGAPAGKASIPSWQLAAANKSNSNTVEAAEAGSGSQEASGSA